MEKISLIVPCYNEEKTIPLFYAECNKVLKDLDLDYEYLFVDDGSKDKTLEILKDLSANDEHVNYYSFSRNFGKEAAMYCGLSNAKGDFTCVIDADLQDPPTLLPEMIKELESGAYDCVATRRVTRKGEPVIRSFFARLFYKIINKISDVDIVDGARDYRLMTKDMVEAIVAMEEYNRFSKGIFGWVGFKTKWLEYENIERVAGETKWSFFKLFKYAIDGIVSFSQAPLSTASWLGMVMTFLSFIAIIFIVIRKIIFGDPVAGWASTICIIAFIGGIQLMMLGIVGKYLSKMYLEVKQRPHYIIAKSNDNNSKRIG